MRDQQSSDRGSWLVFAFVGTLGLRQTAQMLGYTGWLDTLLLVIGLGLGIWMLFTWDRKIGERRRTRRPWNRDQFAQPRRPESLQCVGCDYPIGDLEAKQVAGGERTGTFEIRCPECGIANEIEIDADRCSACGTILSNDHLTPGQIVQCPSCRVSWRIRPWTSRSN